jgi:hypothetical protein
MKVEHGQAPGTQPDAAGPEGAAQHFDLAALQKAAFQAFSRDLPQLLKAHPGKWVAYHGSEQLGVADDDVTLYEASRRRGLEPQEVLVIGIDLEADRIPVVFEADFLPFEAEQATG